MTLGAPLHKLARDAHRFEAEWPLAAARIVQEEASRQAAEATGGDGMLSGWRSLGAAGVEVTGSSGQAEVRATGALWDVLENGTTAHDVAAKRRDEMLRTPHGPRKRVHVRGRPAKHSWTRAAAAANSRIQSATAAVLARLGQ